MYIYEKYVELYKIYIIYYNKNIVKKYNYNIFIIFHFSKTFLTFPVNDNKLSKENRYKYLFIDPKNSGIIFP